MTDEVRAAVTAAAHEFLKSLSRLTLGAKIGFGEIRAVLKQAYVQAAYELIQTREGRSKPNVSRISTVTGISRLDVTSLLAQAYDEVPPVKSGRSRADAVLEGWQSDRQFVDRFTGKPAVLNLRRFKKLVGKYSGDGPAISGTILAELTRGGAVKTRGPDSVRFVRGTCANLGWSPENVASMDEVVMHMRAILHNLEHPETPQYVRAIRCESLDSVEATTILPELIESADDFVESAGVTLGHTQQGSGKRLQSEVTKVTVLVQVLHETAKRSSSQKRAGRGRKPLAGAKFRAKRP
jgi:hypothetical protein